MSENQDTAERILAWARELPDKLTPLVEDSIKASQPELKAGDLVGAQRKARVVVAVSAAGKAVMSLLSVAKAGKRGRATPQQEDEMDHSDDSPETLERLRDELESRLRRLRSVIESKGAGGEPRPWPPARAACESVRPS